MSRGGGTVADMRTASGGTSQPGCTTAKLCRWFCAALVAVAVLIGGCAESGAELVEDLDFLNEGWSQSPMATNLCDTFPEDRAPTSHEDCLRFAEYLDGQGCPIGAFLFGFMTLPGEEQDPLDRRLDDGWAEVGTRYGCEIELSRFSSP